MKSLVFSLCLLCLSSLPAVAQEPGSSLLQNVTSRNKITLNGGWKIIVDPLENGYYNYRYQPRSDGYFTNQKMKSPADLIEYDFDTDAELQVPGDWNTQMEKLYYYEGTVWYKKSFDYPVRSGYRDYVYFEAVNYQARVYLNGEYLGLHEGGYTPFQFEVTGKLKDQGNFLVVKVDNKRKREAVPTLNTDWWNYGGITRPVHLIQVPQKHVSDYVISLSKDAGHITGSIQTSGTSEGDEVRVKIPELGK